MYKPKNRQRGLTLIELLVTLSLTMILSGAVLTSVRTFVRTRAAESDLYEHSHAMLLLSALISRAMRHTDSSRLPLPPLIHSGAALTYSDGSPVTEITQNTLHQPHPNSDALSSVDLDITALMHLKTCQTDGVSLYGEACTLAGRPRMLSKVRNLALISTDGVRVLAGRVQGRGRCRRVSTSLSSSLYDSALGAPLSCSTLALVPVRSLETVYLSTHYRLRLARFSGARVIENQPFAHMLPNQSPAIKFSEDFKAESYQLRAELFLSSGTETRSAGVVTDWAVLSRRDPLWLLMNTR